jgi:hypothetical protein
MDNPKRGPSDATDYSSTKAPETQKHAEERDAPPSDHRLIPGGAHGAKGLQGMAAMERDDNAEYNDERDPNG